MIIFVSARFSWMVIVIGEGQLTQEVYSCGRAFYVVLSTDFFVEWCLCGG